MGKIDDRIVELGITLPDPQSPVANYVPSVRTGNLIYLSGLGPMKAADGTRPIGKLGQDLDTQQGYDAARLVGINMLARIKQAVDGDLDRVKQVVKLLSMVNSTGDFTEHPQVDFVSCVHVQGQIYGVSDALAGAGLAHEAGTREQE